MSMFQRIGFSLELNNRQKNLVLEMKSACTNPGRNRAITEMFAVFVVVIEQELLIAFVLFQS